MQEIFFRLVEKHASSDQTIELWQEISERHSEPHRHYHNLNHLADLYAQLEMIQALIQDWPTLLYSLFYHDIVYEVERNDNEEKSALLAVERMTNIGIPQDMITLCQDQIIATKTHLVSARSDTNYFTDADLSILGRDWQTYDSYRHNIRKEYEIYPEPMYQQGRRMVVQHFLSMDRIYKTDQFYNRFEAAARDNLNKELKSI